MPRRTYTPKHSTVIAYLALFSSLGTGGAFAATQLASNSVGSRQIRTGAVQLSDLSPAAVRALRAKVGPAGPAGPAGATGATGGAGATGQLTAANIVQHAASGPTVTTPGEGRFISVQCGPGERVLGGGGRFGQQSLTSSTPSIMYSAPTPTGWELAFTPDTTVGGHANVYVICLKP